METAAIALPQPEISIASQKNMVGELARKANERWWKLQLFLGKNALTKLMAMEAAGTVVDISLMSAGMHDPLSREPIAAGVDLAVLHKLSGQHEHIANGKHDKLKRLGGTVLMLAAAIGAQKAGLAVAEHAGLAHHFNDGVQIGSKYSVLLGVNGASAMRQRIR